jgi:hypothetical protein
VNGFHLRDKVVPVDDVFRHVLDGIGEEEPVLMAIHPLMRPLLKLDEIDAVAKLELVRVLWNLGQASPTRTSAYLLDQRSWWEAK